MHRLLGSKGTQKNCFWISLISGIGSEMFIYGSKVTDTQLQSGHLTVDLYSPCIISTITDWFLLRWFFHDSLLASTSLFPSDSRTGTSGFFLTLFRSSCKPSNKTFSNSYESYWSWLLNCFLNFAIIFLSSSGATDSFASNQSCFMSLAKPMATLPCVPRGLL